MDYKAKYALCPYYVEKGKMTAEVECEGEILLVKTSRHIFPSKKEALGYFQEYCCKNYKKCEYFKKISKKYGGDVT